MAPCSASINLHANVLPQQMGSKVIPILWSTGVRDNLYVSLRTYSNLVFCMMVEEHSSQCYERPLFAPSAYQSCLVYWSRCRCGMSVCAPGAHHITRQEDRQSHDGLRSFCSLLLQGPSVTNVNRAYFHMKAPQFPVCQTIECRKACILLQHHAGCQMLVQLKGCTDSMH